MADITELLTRLAELSDDELRVVIAEATAQRPGLAAINAAATGHGVPPTPDVPGPVQLDTGTTVGASGMVPGAAADPGYTATGVPTFDSVREKVQGRAGRATGAEELERESAHGRTADEKFAARAQAGRDRLAEIRKSLGLPGAKDEGDA